MAQTIISLDNIDITFRQKNKVIEAVKNVSLTIDKGQIYGIVGYSGAGKSTLVRVINLLQVPTAGKITIDGDVTFDQDNIQISPNELREKRRDIGMIFQHFNLMAQKTAKENIAFALKHSPLSKSEKEQKVQDLLNLVGLSDRSDSYPAQLSGGQKQRVAIARALANDPKILISDEATSALDPKTTKQILALLQDLNKKLDLTIVLITHEMQIVKDICHRVAVMQNGQLIEEGSILEIFSHPKESLTKDFINVATGIDEALPKIEKQKIVQQLQNNAVLVKLNYVGSSTDEPILNRIYKQFDISANILYGNIEILDNTPVGEMIAILEGNEENLEKALLAINDSNVTVDILKKGC
ncbi:methionine ABC transporter ATP-binding protein [Streptococcus marimammalium]|uniref:methionine ABC transporter ATP-binding protein n=1 Tax=Streptococcus marimammalium TaxID=269666 RepID=UPI00037BD4C2|nr:methionine ABC transporter ATP-binding protein [Streptococcus marimammalium]